MLLDKERQFPGQNAMSKCLLVAPSTTHSVLLPGSETQAPPPAPRPMMPVPGLIHERSDRCRLEDNQSTIKLVPPSNSLFASPRESFPSHGLTSQPSSIYSSTSPLIILAPDNYGHCTVTLIGPTASSGARAQNFSSAAYATSITYLSSQQEVAIEMVADAPVAVWAVVDLLACVISCHRQTYKGPNHQVTELCKQCMQGTRPNALADLMLVSYIMSCDAVYHDAAYVAAAEAGNALRMYGMLPGKVVTDGQGRRVPVATIFNHWKVLKAIADVRAPLFIDHIARAAQAHPADPPARAVPALLAVELCPRSLLRLDLSTDLTLSLWLRVSHLLYLMPLEHLSVSLPLASARRERSIQFELKVNEVWTSGDASGPPACSDDIAALAEAAASGGLGRLKHLDLLTSQLDAPCMAALGQLFAAVSPTLASLNLHGSLRLYKLTEQGCCDVLVCDALRPLQRLQALCVTGLMMPGMQMAGGPDGLQHLVPYSELPELAVIVFDAPAPAGHARSARSGRDLGMRLGEAPPAYQARLLSEVAGLRVAQAPPCCQEVLQGSRQPAFLRLSG
eukprot:jgi/Ulvmu1/3338/UM155_0021.1